MKKESLTDYLTISRGDFLLSRNLIPRPDHIYTDNKFLPDRPEKIFDVEALDNYLKFLELLVFNERIFAATFQTFNEKEAKRFYKGELEFMLYTQLNKTKPTIEENVLNQLTKKGLLFFADVKSKDLSPRKFIQDYLSISPQLKDSLHKLINDRKPSLDKNAELFAHILLAERIGVPVCISELARQDGIPFALERKEAESIKKFESAEIKLRNGVLSFLKGKLDQGAQQELARIKELGNTTIYPETPIAWQIIRDSSKLEDFLPVALQLREEYKTFRQTMIKIEDELLSDDTTLNRKNRLVKELDSMANEIWREQENTTQRVAHEFSSLLDIALSQATSLSISNFPKLLEYILGKPTEILLGKLRQKKIKVVLNSKKQFMSSSKWADKISGIFSLPKHEAKEELIKYHSRTKL